MTANRLDQPLAAPGSFRFRGWRSLASCLALVALAACGSPEEKQAKHLERGIAFYKDGNDAKAMIELRNVLRVNPKNAQAMYYFGLLHERAHRWGEAFAAYQAAANEQPDLLEAHVKVGTLALLSNDIAAAKGAADAIEKVAPGHPDALALRGAAALREGDTQKALEFAKEGFAKDPNHENALAVYAGVLQHLGEGQRAVQTIEEALGRNPKSVSLRLLKISLLEQTKDTAAVQAAFDELIAFDPNNEDYRLALANFLQSSDNLSGAEQVLRQVVDSDYGSTRSTAYLIQLIRKAHGFEAADQELRRQIERSPDDYVLRFTLADLNLQDGRFDAAEKELRTIVERAGEGQTSQDAEAAIAQIAFSRNDIARAKATADKVIADNGEHRGANYIRAMVALKENQLDDAVRLARTALRRDPSWLPALKLVAEAHYRRGERDLAIGALNDIIAIDPSDAQVGQALATLLTQRGDYDAALKIWDIVLQQNWRQSQALRSKAQIAIRQQQWGPAQRDIDALLQIPTEQANGALLAGNLLMAQNQLDQSREWFEKALASAPQTSEPVIGVVRSYFAQNQPDKAVAYLAEHTKANPQDAVAFNMMGELAARQSHLDEARAAFQKATELQPGWSTPRRQLGSMFVNTGHMDEAVEVFRTATQAMPDDVDLLNDLAAVLIAADRPNEAIDVYEQVLAKHRSEVAVNNFAALTADYEFTDTAALAKALTLAARFRTSTNPLYLDTLGWLYYRKGDYAVAATYLERAVNMATSRPDLRYHLGMALARSGQKERAVPELRQATAQGVADYHGIDEARTTLAALSAEMQQPKPGQGPRSAATAERPRGPAGGRVRSRRRERALLDQALQGREPVGLGRGLVPADAVDARKAHGDAGFVAGRAVHRVERDLEHELGRHLADRAEALRGVVAHPPVDRGSSSSVKPK